MKKFLLALFVFLIPAICSAGWYEYSPGWYLNGVPGANDGYIYYRTCYCGCYRYCVYGPIPVTTVVNNTNVAYGANWKERLVDALNTKKDNELYIQALVQSGLASPGATVSSAYVGNYGVSGYHTITQGYAQQGSTLYGMAAVPAQQFYGTGAVAAHEFQRSVDGLRDVMAQSYNYAGALTAQKIEGDNVTARILASGQVAAQLAAVNNPPTTTTTAWSNQQTAGVANPQQQQPTAANPYGNREGLIPGITREVLTKQNCGQCHNGAKHQGNFDLAVLDSLQPSDRVKLAQIAHDRMISQDPKVHMPKDHGMLAPQIIEDIAVYLQGNQQQQPPAQAQPPVQAQPQPQQPPPPPPESQPQPEPKPTTPPPEPKPEAKPEATTPQPEY